MENKTKNNRRMIGSQQGDEGGDYVEVSPRRHPRLEDTPGIMLVRVPPTRYALGLVGNDGSIRLFNPGYFMDFNHMVELYATLGEARDARKFFLQHSDSSPDSVVIVRFELEVVE